MKKQSRFNQIITIAISLVILIWAVIYLTQNFGGSKKTTTTISETEEKVEPTFNADIDKDTLSRIKAFDDYGLPEPKNLGKENIFKEE